MGREYNPWRAEGVGAVARCGMGLVDQDVTCKDHLVPSLGQCLERPRSWPPGSPLIDETSLWHGLRAHCREHEPI